MELAVHLPALTGQLLWDDISLVNDNPLIRSPVLTLEAFRHYLFPDAYDGHYRPIQTISYIFDYFFWNKDPSGYHLSNILWHVLSGVLLYYLLRRILGAFPGAMAGQDFLRGAHRLSTAAFFLALLWVVHPVHSAAVDYISGRADSLAFLLRIRGLASLFASTGPFAIMGAPRPVRPGDAVRLCSLCSRESGVLWMLMFLLYVFAFDRRPAASSEVCRPRDLPHPAFRSTPDCASYPSIIPKTGASAGWTPAERGSPYASRAGRLWALDGLSPPGFMSNAPCSSRPQSAVRRAGGMLSRLIILPWQRCAGARGFPSGAFRKGRRTASALVRRQLVSSGLSAYLKSFRS